jgi:RimJ/RimL family protein N-acetyltransferase
MPPVTLRTPRLLLRPFEEADLAPFAALNSHPRVVEFLGSCPTREESDAMVERWATELEREGWGLWAVEVTGGPALAGMCGLHALNPAVPAAPAVEVGWRLHPDHWGNGFATEAGIASLRHGFETAALAEIVSITAVVNQRSQAVMTRLGLRREPEADFDHPSQPVGSPLRAHVLYRMSRDEWVTRQQHGSGD